MAQEVVRQSNGVGEYQISSLQSGLLGSVLLGLYVLLHTLLVPKLPDLWKDIQPPKTRGSARYEGRYQNNAKSVSQQRAQRLSSALLLFCAGLLLLPTAHIYVKVKTVQYDLFEGFQVRPTSSQNKFGYGHFIIFTIILNYGEARFERNTKPDTPYTQRKKKTEWTKIIKLLSLLILLAGDIHLNPGPAVIGDTSRLMGPGAAASEPVMEAGTTPASEPALLRLMSPRRSDAAVHMLNMPTTDALQLKGGRVLLPRREAVESAGAVAAGGVAAPVSKAGSAATGRWTTHVSSGSESPGKRRATPIVCEERETTSQEDNVGIFFSPSIKTRSRDRPSSPITTEAVSIPTEQNGAGQKPTTGAVVSKQSSQRIFSTVNHAKVKWDKNSKPKGIFGAHLNIRSLLPKHDEIKSLLMESNLHFLALSETWLNSKIHSNLIDIPGYSFYRNDRKTGKGGGVAIYLRDSLKCTKVTLEHDVNIEHICVEVSLSLSMHFLIVVLYNPPSCNEMFYGELDKLLKMVAHKSEVIILGDFNIDWFNSSKRKKLKTLMTKFDFTQIMKGATRISKTSKTQIDLIFSNKEDRILKSYNFLTGLSDHNMILIARKLSKKRLQNVNNVKSNILTIFKRDFPVLDNELNGISWSNILENEDVHNCCKEIISRLEEVISKFLKKQKHLKKRSLPWLNDDIRRLMKERDMALKKSLKSKSNTDINIYKSLRNRVTKNLRNAKIEYYISTITEAKGNPSILWKQINSIVKPQNTTTMIELKIGDHQIRDIKQIAQEFNNYFVSSVEELVQQFNFGNLIRPVQQQVTSSTTFSLEQTSESIVLDAINTIKLSNCMDLSHINTAFVKRNKNALIKPLTHVINLSIESGQFPAPWKQARVIPIFKSGSQDQACNYRPISILPVFSKVLEKIVSNQLMAYIQYHKI